MNSLIEIVNDISKRNALKYLVGCLEGKKQTDTFESICTENLPFGYEIVDTIYTNAEKLTLIADSHFSKEYDDFFAKSESYQLTPNNFTDFFALALSSNKHKFAMDLLDWRMSKISNKKKRKIESLDIENINSIYLDVFNSTSFKKLTLIGTLNFLDISLKKNILKTFLRLISNIQDVYRLSEEKFDILINEKFNDEKASKSTKNALITFAIKCDICDKFKDNIIKTIIDGDIYYENFSYIIRSFFHSRKEVLVFTEKNINDVNKMLFYRYFLDNKISYLPAEEQIRNTIKEYVNLFNQVIEFLIANNYIVNQDYLSYVATNRYCFINKSKDYLPEKTKEKLHDIIAGNNRVGINYFKHNQISFMFYQHSNKYIESLKNMKINLEQLQKSYFTNPPKDFKDYEYTISQIQFYREESTNNLTKIIVKLLSMNYVKLLGPRGPVEFGKTKFWYTKEFRSSSLFNKFTSLINEAEQTLSRNYEIGKGKSKKKLLERLLFFSERLYKNTLKYLEILSHK